MLHRGIRESDLKQVVNRLYLTGGMAQKSQGYLLFRYSHSVICDTDERGCRPPDLHRDR